MRKRFLVMLISGLVLLNLNNNVCTVRADDDMTAEETVMEEETEEITEIETEAVEDMPEEDPENGDMPQGFVEVASWEELRNAMDAGEDIILSQDILCPKDGGELEYWGGTLDLNGHKIDACGYQKKVIAIHGEFSLLDSVGGGIITGSTGDSYECCGIYVNACSIMNFYGGMIIGTDSGIYVGSDSELNIYGGIIKDCNRHGIHLYNKTTLNMFGGEITENQTGVMIESPNTIVNISGSPKVLDKIEINYEDCILNIVGKLEDAILYINVRERLDCVLTSGYSQYNTEDPTKYFKSADDNFLIVKTEEGEVARWSNYPIYLYKEGSGTVEFSERAHLGDEIKINTVPDEGYELIKLTYQPWGSDEVDITETRSFIMPDRPVTVSAIFMEYPQAVAKSRITFSLDGGTLDGKTGSIEIEAAIGDEITIPDAPVREGYKFLYWKGSEYHPGDKYTVIGDHSFTAVWEKEEEKKEADTESKKAVVTDKKKYDGNVKTGDGTETGLIVLIMSISLAGSGIIYRKKQKK